MNTSQLPSKSKAGTSEIASFSINYQDVNQSISTLLTHIQSLSKKYYSHLNPYYAPYIVINQSSGYGKSRLIKEVAHHISTIYFCFRESNSTDFPPGLLPIEWFSPAFTQAKSSNSLLDYAEFVLLSSLKLMLEFKMDNQTLIDSQVSPSSDFHNTLHKSINPVSFSDDDLESIAGQIQGFEMKELGSPILFVFDEASFLLQKLDHIKTTDPDGIQDLFRAFRRALKTLVRDYKLFPLRIFGIFLDTSPKISKFAPSLEFDPSAKNSRLKLMPVYYEMETFDCFYNAKFASGECQLTVSYLRTRFGCDSYYLYGRPVWGSQCAVAISSNDDEKKEANRFILKLAIDKLSNPQLSLQYLVCFLQRCGWNGMPSFEMAEQLVASHMATLYYVSPCRTTFTLTYPSEPILSEAAAYITGAKDGYLIGVEEILKFVRTHQLNTGSMGELIARLLCLFAVDYARWINHRYHVSKPVSVLKFLEGLVHSAYRRLFSTISSKIAKSVLNFNHFIVRSDQSQFMLDLAGPALRRCAAFSCKPLQCGIDLAIPILSEENEPSFIFIQVNNTTSMLSNEKLSQCLDKMKPQSVFGHESFSDRDSFLKLIFLFHSSGPKRRKWESESESESGPDLVFSIPGQVDNLVFSGLKAFKIDSKLMDVMESYLPTPWLEDLMDNEKSFDIRFPLIR
jgi:hypothetical protein